MQTESNHLPTTRRTTIHPLRNSRFVLILILLVLSACSGASGGESTHTTATVEVATNATAATTVTSDAVTAPDEVASAPVTSIMAELGLKGEQYAALGDPEAPITVVEFSDYGCPFCRRYSTTTFPEIKKAYIDTGKVYYVFKDYPITQLHPQAEIASQAAECAGAQGKYWEMHEALFAQPEEWDTTEAAARDAMTRYAQEFSLDGTQFASCMQSDTLARSDVEANMAEGRQLGLTGTPSFVINGKLLAGAQPLDVFERVLDREIQSAGGAE